MRTAIGVVAVVIGLFSEMQPTQVSYDIRSRHEAVMRALAACSSADLSHLVHPIRGLRLSLDAFVDDQDPAFAIAQVSRALSDTTTFAYGELDGSEMIYSSLAREMAGWCRVRYNDADSVSFDHRVGVGNTANNVGEYFPGAVFVEYYFAGTGESKDFNWSSLRFVYQRYESTWCLVAIVNDFWTI
jgi:hypothetical protein